MVRETRHLWVGNLPENIPEERVFEHFKRYGRVQSIKLLPGGDATVSFNDIKSAAKAHEVEHMLDERRLSTEYCEPNAVHAKVAAAANASRFTINSSCTSSTTTEDAPSLHSSSSSHLFGSSASSSASSGVAPLTPSSPLSNCTSSSLDAGGGGYHPRRTPVPTAYHGGIPSGADSLRGRPRERLYRNGPPYPSPTERLSSSNHRRNWSYDSSTTNRYSLTDVSTPTTPHDVTSPPLSTASTLSSIVLAKLPRKQQQQSGSSESRSGSQSSRSRSPPRSPLRLSPRSPAGRSSSASTRSSRSSEPPSSSPRSDGKIRGHGGVVGVVASTLPVYSEDGRPLAICVRDLPARSSDTSLKDGLFHEYKKHGKVTWVKVVGNGSERYALVCFKKPEDVDKAIEVSQDKFFFGCKIDVAPYHGYDIEDNETKPYDAEHDEYHPKATRTLFIGNLSKDITEREIRQHFEQFGEIIEIDMKKHSTAGTQSYAFCQYAEIGSVVRAIRALDGELLGDTRLKLGFGKSMAVNCVWVAGIGDQLVDKTLHAQFAKYGTVTRVAVDRLRGQALIFYDQLQSATMAVKEMRGVSLRGRRIQIDYASRECQEAFFKRMEDRDGWSATTEDPRRYDSRMARGFSRSSDGRTPRRHDTVFSDSPRYRSLENLSPGSEDEIMSPSSTELNHLHKRRDQIQKLLRLNVHEKEKSRPARSVTAADQGLVVTTHNHRRRLSSHRRSSGESSSAPLCKRRKTGSTSEDERRRHAHHSGDDSRPGTPLIDELPDQHSNKPKEPRRGPQKRPDEPMCLPLPAFAATCFTMQSKQSPMRSPKETPPPAFTPASPSRPQSPLSSSSSVVSPRGSPTLEERLRSLDEKFETWASRTQPVVSSTVRPRHHLLEVDVREIQPSDIVKSVLAKPSVFDEDSKRLENVNDKYEPKDFSTYQRPLGIDTSFSTKLNLLSPRPSAVKGLQYPFPSYPVRSSSTLLPSSSPVPQPPQPVQKPSHSYQPKVESWLGISKPSTENSDFASRFQSRYLHDLPNPSPPTSSSSAKLSDPRLEKSPVSPAIASGFVSKMPPRLGEVRPEKPVTVRPQTADVHRVWKPSEEPPRLPPLPSPKTQNILSVRPEVPEHSSRSSCLVQDVRKERDKVSVDLNSDKTLADSEVSDKSNNNRGPVHSEPAKHQTDSTKLGFTNSLVSKSNPINNHGDAVMIPNAVQNDTDSSLHKVVCKPGDNGLVAVVEVRTQATTSNDSKDKTACDTEVNRTVENSDSKESRDKLLKKPKEKDLPESVDKERKKEREIEIERKKDRDSIDVTEKRKNSCDHKEEADLCKKDELLDRRKKVLDHHERKTIDHHDRSKKKEEEKEKKRENGHEKKKEHSEKHRKSDERRREDSEKRKDKEAAAASAAAQICNKRRISSQESLNDDENLKKLKAEAKRRDSKDGKPSSSLSQSKHKSLEKKDKPVSISKSGDPHSSDQKRKDEKRSDHEKKKYLNETADPLKKRIKEEVKKVPTKTNHISLKHSNNEHEDDKFLKKAHSKDKKKVFTSSDLLEDKKLKKEKRLSSDSKKDDEKTKEMVVNGHNSGSESDSEEPKKRSIFDVEIDEPVYISMYDKVKARSTKNLQKQEEEKRQVKLKEKFSKLKQSRAKREEKKRSTSWDEDSDSDASIVRRRHRQQSAARLSSDDEDEDVPPPPKLDTVPNKGLYDTSEDEKSKVAIKPTPASKLCASDIYSDESDINEGGFNKSSSKKIMNSGVVDEAKNKINKSSSSSSSMKSESKQKSRPQSFEAEINEKKRLTQDPMSENEQYQYERERKKAKKREKRLKSSEEEAKYTEDRKKRERRKSIQLDDYEDENKPRSKKPKLDSSHVEDARMEEIFGTLSEESNHSLQKAEPTQNSSKWSFLQVYGSDSDSTNNYVRKKEKKKKEKKHREPCKEVAQDGQELTCAQYSDDIMREKKKKRKKSKDEKGRHHHHHHHHHDNSATVKSTEPAEVEAPPALPLLMNMPSSPLSSSQKSPPPLTMPVLTPKSVRKETPHQDEKDKIEQQTKVAESAVRSIQEPTTVEPVKKPDVLAAEDSSNKNTKERVVISQEETEVAVASLLGETFSGPQWGSDGSPPNTEAEPPAAHDEQEMLQAVQSLNDEKPDTPQSDADLHIDTDAEENNDEFSSGVRLDYLPKTPDMDLSAPPKTPEISPSTSTSASTSTSTSISTSTSTLTSTTTSTLTTTTTSTTTTITTTTTTSISPSVSVSVSSKPPAYVRKDPIRNSREDLDVPAVVEQFNTPEKTPSEKPPPLLTPATPKLREEPIIKTSEKIVLNSRDRLILVPPPLVPVSKPMSLSPTKTIALSRPLITLSSTTAATVLSNISTTSPATVFVKKPPPYALPQTSPTLVTRMPNNPPPILSPVTPCAQKMPSPTLTSPRFSNTIVSPRQHLTATHIIVSRPVSAFSGEMPALVPAEPSSKTIRPSIVAQVIQSPPRPSPSLSNPIKLPTPSVQENTSVQTSVIATTPVSTVKLVSSCPSTISAPISAPPTVLTSTGNAPPCKSEVSVICAKPIAAVTVAVAAEVSSEPSVALSETKKTEIVETQKQTAPSAERSADEMKPKVCEPRETKQSSESSLATEKLQPSEPISQPLETPKPEPTEPVTIKEEDSKTEPPEFIPKTDVINEHESVKEEPIVLEQQTSVNESVIKRVEDEKLDKREKLMEESKESSSDEDKPITSLAKNMKKKAARGGRGGRSGRGSGGRGGRGRGRGGRSNSDPKRLTSDDVYEFHESDEEGGAANANARQPLILTIKSPSANNPSVSPKASSLSPKEPTKTSPNVVPVTQQQQPPKTGIMTPVKDCSSRESSPTKSPEKDNGNTRKSRRLLEKDTSKNTVDEVIEDVIRNASHPRRSTRQVPQPVKQPTTPVAIPKKGKKKAPADDDSRSTPEDQPTRSPSPLKAAPSPQLSTGASAPTLTVTTESTQSHAESEPMTLIDPVTGMLMVVRAKEEGKYVPVAPAIASPTPVPSPAKPDTPVAVLSEGLGSHWVAMDVSKQKIEKHTYPPSSPSKPCAEVPPMPLRLTSKYMDAPKPYHAQQQPQTANLMQQRVQSTPMALQRNMDGVADLRVEVPAQPEPAKPLKSAKCGGVGVGAIAGRPAQQQPLHHQPKPYTPSTPATAHSYPKPPHQHHPPPIQPPPPSIHRSNIVMSASPAASKPPTALARGGGLLMPAAVVNSPPAHEHPHPMTGAVASPPPRAPHYASQQPVVTGASSSRVATVAGAAAARMDATLHKSGRNMHSPPPAHQQGEGVSVTHGMANFMPGFIYPPYISNLLASQYSLPSSSTPIGYDERTAGDMNHSPPLDHRSAPYRHPFSAGRTYLEEPPPAHLHGSAAAAAQHHRRTAHVAADMAGHTAHAPHEGMMRTIDCGNAAGGGAVGGQPRLQVATPPHASQVPSQAESLFGLLQNFPIMWQGLLALKNDQSSVQMYFVLGNEEVARQSLRVNRDGSTSPLRIAQRMRLEPAQLEGVARKMQTENEHCMLLALPCGRDQVDVLKQSMSLQSAFISYLQQKQAAGIVNIAHPGSQQPAYVVHIFPSCDFANENLARAAPDLLHRMQEIPHLIIVIATV